MAYIYVEKLVPLYYEEKGSGTPIVFIHPPGMGSVTFHRQHALSSSFRIITYDLRGNGKSGKGIKKITMDLLASDLHQLLNELQIERAIVCGYSNGGSIAQHFALSYPHQVEKLILIGGFSEVCTHLLYLEFLLGIYTVKYRSIPLLAKVLGKAHGKTKDEKKMIEHYARLCDQDRLYEMYVEGLHYRSTHRLYELNIPILLIYGALDYYVHEYGRIFQKHAHHVDIVYVENAKHQIPTKHADELNAIIRAYH
ncbi:pimeloyl-ACP methyl ester carboxylesterase [Thermolongibacillus altinsuensis]|jgi:pimeloyl-ACP methyl ester carboxylesterase|uniref:Pimeloyl-ACP methyl ester carboxylesterase n=1 Tax=Thermolongibacillus altinsuensis TaxID=575256 RepID=A0A4R1QH82_9BACL|nr:alpha/beta hydrolase [Thermolongibacillus altinsuensis]TCL49218.1 pimeloyl-ACP methyl ester carboxylesterase [Thermolongibacillus altinsuensis]GMB08666.1 hydrolase [Thermolongibacillus altinsuensis]